VSRRWRVGRKNYDAERQATVTANSGDASTLCDRGVVKNSRKTTLLSGGQQALRATSTLAAAGGHRGIFARQTGGGTGDT